MDSSKEGQMRDIKRQLRPQHARFCAEYIKTYDVKRSAMAAGYVERSAATTGRAVLENPLVRKYILLLQDIQNERSFVTASRIERELAKIAFSDIMDFVQVVDYAVNGGAPDPETGEPQSRTYQQIELRDLDKIDTAAIKEIKHTRDGLQVKLHCKEAALDKMMRYKGMFGVDNAQQRPIITISGERPEESETDTGGGN